MDSELKREIMIDNYKNPFNKGLKNEDGYVKTNKSSSSCIDNFDIELRLEDNVIKDIRYDGEACVIATSSMSISVENLIGKTKKEALEIINNYLNMIEEKDYNKDLLNELNIYEDINKQPSRKKCATLGIIGIKEILEEN